jgi:signal transduction histidine kinase
MRANRHLLAQALANLLDNAIKYTPPGGRVRLQVERGANGPVIAVADSGPGIPETDRERVLQRFVRLDATRSTPGNGLGLSLVDAVAKLHGAELMLTDNRPGLRVSLAFRASEEERAQKAAA